MTERETILSLLRLGWSERRIAREGGHHRATIRRIRREAGLLEAKCTTPGDVPTDLPAAPRSSAAPFSVFIEAELGKRRNAAAIYQDLVEHHGYTGSYDAVKRLARKLRVNAPKISCRFETEPGAEGQVDYGEGALTRDPRTGKYRRPRLFVMTLGNSRHAFRKTIWKSSTETWCRLHEDGFAYFGGAPRTIRLDNLKEGVIKPDVYDPQLNGLYAKMLAHHGVVALPCRPYAPDLKGKVESAVGYTQSTALKGRRFESIDEQNTFLAHWNERWAATRIHGTTKQQVRAMFEAERPFLLPLPVTRFEYYRSCERTVHFDGYIEVDSAYYMAPPIYIGTKVIVHVGRLWLRILDPTTHQCVRTFALAVRKGQRRAVDADRPKQTPPQVEKLAARVAGAGPGCAAFARALVAQRGAEALRALFGMLDLLRRYDAAAVDRACSFAASSGIASLRFVRTYLGHHATTTKLQAEHRIIPEIEIYTKHFTTLTKGASS
uniref:Transposase of ISCARN65, IS21 family n=1 Tax=mine drainage metagenome TaxID=410659 RepID=E6Q2E6_9ZZZZ